MPRRLYVQLVLLLALGLTATVVGFGWWMGNNQAQAHVDGIRQNARALAHAHADDAAHFMAVEEYAALEELLVQSARFPEVTLIRLHAPDGELLLEIESDPGDAEPRVSYEGGKGTVPAALETIVREERGALVVWTPVIAGSLLGWLETSYSLESVENVKASIWRQTFLLGVLWVALALGLVTAVLYRPMAAIRELSLFARDLARRKGERVTVPRSADEIGVLADALDHASLELADAERRLVAEGERLSVTLQSLGEGVIACDREGRITLMNGVAEALTGWTREEAIGRAFEAVYSVLDEEKREAIPVTLQGAISAGHVLDAEGSATLAARDGTLRHVSDSTARIVDASGAVVGAVVVFRDESERLAAARVRADLEAQLRHSQKMEAVGHLAGGIAHDFNNILTGIVGYGSLLLETSTPGEQHEAAQEILRAAARATTLTRGLLAFSRKQRMELRPVDLNDVVRGLERMLRRVLGEEVELRTELCARSIVANVDPAQIEQVLVNLAMNAKDAMPAGGLLGIATGAVQAEEAGESGARLPISGPLAQLTVSDTGAGMDPELLQRMFEPFFTTKEVGKGTGLGLSIVHGIIQQHGGAIRVYSQRGIGTTFKIYLPLTAGVATSQALEEREPVRGGTERILLVEDELEVRRVIRAILQSAGYTVVEATDGAAALEVLGSGDPFQLLLSDVIMPHMNGRELRRVVRERLPGLPVLFISGYTFDVIRHRGLIDDSVDLLMKPFTSRTLLARVREVLDRERALDRVS